ncbi:thymidylate kinase [Kitasatospora sp. NPDC096128]|uniref:dTMP kinase n=1 Tax=Kitasatospora sp. NPDC096128 TaxID=3155547 RepID=UPI003332D267
MNNENLPPGFLAVVEGLDGTGKTTLRKGLFRLIESLYGTTPLSILTTNWLDPSVAADLEEGKYRPSEANRARYLAALRADKRASVEQLIVPALRHRPVIADRWLLSELAFFAVKHGASAKETYAALEDAIAVRADLTLLLEHSPEEAMARAASRSGDAVREDWDVLDVQTRVRRTYDEVAADPAAFPKLGPIVRIDASLDRAGVLAAAWTALREHQLLPALPLKETT